MSELQLRYAGPEDNALLAELGRETFADTFAADNTPENMAAYLAQSFSPARQAQELADPNCRFMIAQLGDDIVGFTKIQFGPAPAAVGGRRPMEISRIYARKPWIGKGIGSRLMQACLDEAAHGGCDVVWLGVWQRNPRAIAFYRQWGFEVAGTATFQLGDDPQVDYLMTRSVQSENPAPSPP